MDGGAKRHWARLRPTFCSSIYPSSIESLKEEIVRVGRWEGELTQTRRDGETIVVSSRWALQRDENGQPAAVLQINTDITERKQADENLSVHAESIGAYGSRDNDGRIGCVNRS